MTETHVSASLGKAEVRVHVGSAPTHWTAPGAGRGRAPAFTAGTSVVQTVRIALDNIN